MHQFYVDGVVESQVSATGSARTDLQAKTNTRRLVELLGTGQNGDQS